MTRADCLGQGRQILRSLYCSRFDEDEIISERMSFDDHDRPHLRQNARRCHPKRLTSARGSALNAPTKNVLKSVPFHPPCRRDFTGKRSSTIRTSRNPRSNWRNSPALYFKSTGASSCSSGTFINFESAFNHEMRLYAWKTASPPGFNTRRHSSTSCCGCAVYCTTPWAYTRSKLPSANGKRSPFASRKSAFSPCCSKFCFARAIAEDDRSTPNGIAPPRANRARSVPAPHPTSRT